MGLSNREGEQLQRLAVLSPGDILEIGALHGKSTTYLAAGTPHTVYSVDLWDMVSADDARKDLYTDPKGYQKYLEVIQGLDNIVPVKGSSKEIGKIWNIPLGMLFIDGDHTYEGAKLDYENFAPHVILGGYLAMHDYHEPEVRRVIDEIVKPSGLWVEFKVVRYLFIARRNDVLLRE